MRSVGVHLLACELCVYWLHTCDDLTNDHASYVLTDDERS